MIYNHGGLEIFICIVVIVDLSYRSLQCSSLFNVSGDVTDTYYIYDLKKTIIQASKSIVRVKLASPLE